MNKVAEIMNNKFDPRFTYAVCWQILEYGKKTCSEYTDEEIAEVHGNDMFSDGFYQEMLKTVREICTKCTTTNILQFIQSELNPCGAKSITLYREDFNEFAWVALCNELDKDQEDDWIIEGMFLED